MTDASDMPQPGELVAEKYRIRDVIGRGGMGTVFRAQHELTGKHVALKWLLPEFTANEEAIERFTREAQATGRIDHPNVVDIYDVGRDRGSMFLVMELLRGESLAKLLEAGPLTPADAVRILMPVFRGVAAAHAEGVIHRDLKPENVFLCRDTHGYPLEPKVLDFGISKVGAATQRNELTNVGEVVGTPYYMSPEQARGLALDGRSDVYALGVVLFEALTGRRPFEDEAFSALAIRIATETPPRADEVRPELPKALADVVETALSRDHRNRYSDVASLAHALEPFGDGVTFERKEREWTGSIAVGPSDEQGVDTGPVTADFDEDQLDGEQRAVLPVSRTPRYTLFGVIVLCVFGAAAAVALAWTGSSAAKTQDPDAASSGDSRQPTASASEANAATPQDALPTGIAAPPSSSSSETETNSSNDDTADPTEPAGRGGKPAKADESTASRQSDARRERPTEGQRKRQLDQRGQTARSAGAAPEREEDSKNAASEPQQERKPEERASSGPKKGGDTSGESKDAQQSSETSSDPDNAEQSSETSSSDGSNEPQKGRLDIRVDSSDF